MPRNPFKRGLGTDNMFEKCKWIKIVCLRTLTSGISGLYLFPVLMVNTKKNKHDSAGGDMEKGEHLGTVGGSENRHSHCENSVFIP